MSDLRELYQEVILDHNRRPRNFGELEPPCSEADGHNPLCGDQIRVYVRIVDGKIEKVMFQGSGCAISKASASMMTDALTGKSVQDAAKLFEGFQAMVTSDMDATVGDEMGKLAVFAGVREFPARIKCASLAWHTLQAALKGAHEMVSTE